MASFDVNPGCEGNGLKKETADILKAQDLDSKEALTIVLVADVDKIHITLLLSKGYHETVRIVATTLGPDTMYPDWPGEQVLLLAEMCA